MSTPDSKITDSVWEYSFRGPKDIMKAVAPTEENYLGDCLLTEGNPLTLVGPSGVHKSRLLLKLAADCSLGRNFFYFPTRAVGKKWLIIQVENTTSRLQKDLQALQQTMTGAEWDQFHSSVQIHQLEHSHDRNVFLDEPANVDRLLDAILKFQADIVCFDSLYFFSTGDLNSDRDMWCTLDRIASLTAAGNIRRTPVVIHHALIGKEAAQKATGFERGNFSRNSKVLHMWTRGQINVSPGDSQCRSIVVSCGKAANGPEFVTFAAKYHQGTLMSDPQFDFDRWHELVNGPRRTK